MEDADPLAEVVAPILDALAERPRVHAAALVLHGGSSSLVRARRPGAAERLTRERTRAWPPAARSAHVIGRSAGDYAAVAAIDREWSVWLLFEGTGDPSAELDALDEAADRLREHLDAWLGAAEAEV